MRAMRHGARLALTVAAFASSGSACTTVLYKGPSRPSSEIAVLTSNDTLIAQVDGLRVSDRASGNYARFEVLPGLHEVGIGLNHVIPGVFTTTIQRSGYITVCVELEAGHSYRTRAVINGRRWVPQVVDETTHELIDPYCEDDEKTAPAASAATGDGAAAATGGAGPGASPAATVSLPAPRVPAPPVPQERDDSSAARPSDRRPGTGLSLLLGFGFGGADFVKATDGNGNDETLSSGTGVIFGAGGMLTPLWPTEGLGLGLGVDAAIKYDSIDAANGSASITRYPVAFTAHFLTNGSGGGPHYFFVKGGVTRDFGVNYSASGFAALNADVHGSWGPTGSIGYYKRSNDFFAWDLMGFFAITDHIAGTQKINADSFGITMGLHLNL
jgi:hypothetical protein